MGEQPQRAAAICTECGNALAVQVWSDGSIRPIGTGVECSCGCETFEVLESSVSVPSPDDERERSEI
ncbi:hypothetical protein [Natronobacterium gregoryi]|uniref:Uncharacterized protein n=2 Tax=Natronobacterium gregoryi TaxID=44930 RepID=L0ADC8_NATGS|nr:hypothetical protein [Natronobacterium gregoryi]AFZ71439.1 hypothetical protein Natgr_0176 [Natronobacterium gregoryi SP2]ELY66741.1 hypothetical protein C490_12030 [Natronobacterium gregoryi SP2]PLK19967.1 hypothetical protein CYV19_12215 [Natronobacterium gregoryi SP2]SFJ35890.1 hypothetical protein SAMN05443661_1248 [Natronobacterium gregoryi]